MIVFRPNHYSNITVLGHILHYEELYCDLRDKDALYEISAYRSGWDCLTEAGQTEYLSSVFKRFLTEILPEQSNWGNNEQDYDAALASNDSTLRRLLALSGKHREELYKEDSDILKWLIARSILNEKKRGEVADNAMPILDELVNYKCSSVRMVVAEFGHKPHLDILITDEMPHIRKEVASHAHQDHLDILVTDEDYMVRRKVAELGGDKHLNALCSDEESSVRIAIAKRGKCASLLAKDESWYVRKALALNADKESVVAANLVDDPIAAIRCEVASRGIALDRLVNDADEYVRADVAKQGRIQDLEVLVKDESRIVRLAVVKQGYGLAQLVKDSDDDVRQQAICYPADLKNLVREHY